MIPGSSDLTTSTLTKIKVFLSVSSILLTASLGLLIPSLVYSVETNQRLSSPRLENPVDQIISRLINSTGDLILPTRYSVPSKYLVPPSNQGQRGVCWGFAAIDMLESQYRAHGIDNNWLSPNSYVTFSKQAYLKFLLDKCEYRKDVAACQHGGFAYNSTDDHLVDAIYYFLKAFPDLSTSILPSSICPYQPAPSGQDLCDGMESALASNPIQFAITSLSAANDIAGTKRLLVDAKRPLAVGIPIDAYRYYAPCDSSNYSTSADCLNRLYTCPDGFPSQYCYRLDLDTRVRDGTFGYVSDIERVRVLGGHAMNIVGYNDDWIYHSRKSSERGLAPMRGGFIMHNSWGEPGHSVAYLLGRLSEENEAVQCPNVLCPMNWIPATAECLRAHGGDVSACGTAFQRVRGRARTAHADALKCRDRSYCDVNRSYALAELNGDVDVQALFNGLDRVHLISWTSGDDVREEWVDWFPFFALRTMLEPVVVVENEAGLCGYWVYPYEDVELVNRVEWSLLDTFHVTDIEFEFTNESYANSGQRSAGKDYSFLESSLGAYQTLDFDGPLPYDYVYNVGMSSKEF